MQNTAVKTWSGQEGNFQAGSNAFLVRAKANSEAQLGKYAGSSDKAANETLFVAGHKYWFKKHNHKQQVNRFNKNIFKLIIIIIRVSYEYIYYSRNTSSISN